MKKRAFQTVGLVLLATCAVAVRVYGGQEPNLRGTVVDPIGARIPNAQVDLYCSNDEWHVKTDATGTFSFPVLLPGIYDLDVTSPGFRKQIIQNIRVGSSEVTPLVITMQVGTSADSCGDSFSRVTYADSLGESGIRGLVKFVSYREVSDGGNERTVSSDELAYGVKVSVLRNDSSGKAAAVLTNERGEFEFVGLEPGLYLLKASRKDAVDFAIANVRIRPRRILEVAFSIRPSGDVTICE